MVFSRRSRLCQASNLSAFAEVQVASAERLIEWAHIVASPFTLNQLDTSILQTTYRTYRSQQNRMFSTVMCMHEQCKAQWTLAEAGQLGKRGQASRYQETYHAHHAVFR